MEKKNTFTALRDYFFTGLIIVLPAMGTAYLLVIAFRFVDGLLGRFLSSYLRENFGFYVPGLGLILFLLVIIFIGIMARYLLGRRLMHWVEDSAVKLPLVKNIYPSFKQIVDFFFTRKKEYFKKVVLVEYPRKGIWSLGFVTNEAPAIVNQTTNADLLNVFIPTTPSPLSGYVIFVPRNEMVALDLSIEDAIKVIVSGGVLNPGENGKK